jgi:predicted homoserine dehydrogenase-like protein
MVTSRAVKAAMMTGAAKEDASGKTLTLAVNAVLRKSIKAARAVLIGMGQIGIALIAAVPAVPGLMALGKANAETAKGQVAKDQAVKDQADSALIKARAGTEEATETAEADAVRAAVKAEAVKAEAVVRVVKVVAAVKEVGAEAVRAGNQIRRHGELCLQMP